MFTEWTLFDSETNKLKFCEAYNQKDAIRKAISWDIIPRKTDDVRPRVPKTLSDNRVMPPQEFQNFMDQISE